VTDQHTIAIILVVVSAAVLVMPLLDRQLRTSPARSVPGQTRLVTSGRDVRVTIHRSLAIAAGATVVVLGWGEYEHWRSSHRQVNRDRANSPGSEAVLVLGFRNRGDRANAVNRWRARAGVRSQQPGLGPTTLVLCGGTAGASPPEAELMARYLRESVGYRGELQLETESRSTWENIHNAIPLIEKTDRIKIVSNPLHAEKGRIYLTQLRPDLAARLVRANEYRLGEWILAKPLLAVIGRRDLYRVGRGL
jgi:hypothetical protein